MDLLFLSLSILNKFIPFYFLTPTSIRLLCESLTLFCHSAPLLSPRLILLTLSFMSPLNYYYHSYSQFYAMPWSSLLGWTLILPDYDCDVLLLTSKVSSTRGPQFTGEGPLYFPLHVVKYLFNLCILTPLEC